MQEPPIYLPIALVGSYDALWDYTLGHAPRYAKIGVEVSAIVINWPYVYKGIRAEYCITEWNLVNHEIRSDGFITGKPGGKRSIEIKIHGVTLYHAHYRLANWNGYGYKPVGERKFRQVSLANG